MTDKNASSIIEVVRAKIKSGDCFYRILFLLVKRFGNGESNDVWFV